MELYNKKDLEYKNGYLVCGNKVIGIDNAIVDCANFVELNLQKANYKAEHGGNIEPQTDPMEGFKRKSEHDLLEVEIETPLLDKKVDETVQLMKEIDRAGKAKEINDYLEYIKLFVQFIAEDTVVSNDQQTRQLKFDLPTIGNPLELTEADIVGIASQIVELR